MKLLRKYKVEILLACVIVALYFFLRLFHLTSLPVFTDEAIYLRWAQIALNDAGWRFISLTDGKQPLFIWLVMVNMKLIDDPLLAGRLISVFAGFSTLVGLFLLGRELFKNRFIGIIASALYVLSPFAYVYDRFALYDSLVGTFTVWGIFLTVLLVRTIRLDIALLLGLLAGTAALNKTNGFFIVGLMPLSLLLFDLRKKDRTKRFLKWVGFFVIIAVLSYALYSILRLSPFFYIIAQKNETFVYPFGEWIKHPFEFFWPNLWNLEIKWLWLYLTPPTIVMIFASFIISKKFLREKIYLFLWFLAPFLFLALFGKVLYPRYLLFNSLPLFLLASFSFYYLYLYLKNKWLFAVLFVLLNLWSVYAIFMTLTNFNRAPIPEAEQFQYSKGWPAGGGVSQSLEFFKNEAHNKQIAVWTAGTFGLMPYAYEIYLTDYPQIEVKGFWPVKDFPSEEILLSAGSKPTYVVFYQPCVPCSTVGVAPSSWKLEKVLQIQKDTDTFLTVYKVPQQ